MRENWGVTTPLLDPTAREFLEHLGLPAQYPVRSSQNASVKGHLGTHEELFSVGEGVFELPDAHIRRGHDVSLSPPIVGPISLLELHDGSLYEVLLTATTMFAPTVAMAELWLRLIAFFMCPFCLLWMIHRELRELAKRNYTRSRQKQMTEERNNTADLCYLNESTSKSQEENKIIVMSLLGLANSAVLFTDSLYVYEFGRTFGFSVFLLSSILALRSALSTQSWSKRKNKKIAYISVTSVLIVTTLFVFLQSNSTPTLKANLGISSCGTMEKVVTLDTCSNEVERHHSLMHVLDPGVDLPTIEPGLYFSSSNPFISSVISNWPKPSRTYSVENGATPYLVNGDQRTGIPFIVNKIIDQQYVRVYVQNPFDGEYLALDIAFPYYGYEGNIQVIDKEKDVQPFIHDSNKPVYLVLHGLNGGSHEEYVKDFVLRRRSEGSTIIVLIARGMMDTTVEGWNVFHGARTGDVDIASRAIRRGLDSLARVQQRPHRQILAGVGFSMGAIILSNYVARSGAHCALDSAIAISGGLDMRQQLNCKRSMRLWQPMLTFGLREDILIRKYARHYKHRLTKKQFINMLRVTSISDLDVEAIVNYNSFNDLMHYYSEMSAMGDIATEFNLFNESYQSTCDADNRKIWGRIANVSIPFVVLQALDDPLVSWRTIGTERPQELVDSGSGNIIMLLTKAGGHVGWPLGHNPQKNGWKWMNDVVKNFVFAVAAVKHLEK